MPPESVHAQRHFLGFEMMPYATILRTDPERRLFVNLFIGEPGERL